MTEDRPTEVSLLNTLLEREANWALYYYNRKAKGSEAVKDTIKQQLVSSLKREMDVFRSVNEKLIAEMERIERTKQTALEVFVSI